MLIKDNENELYHSGIYLGKDYSEGIKHWKYIKKERKNGRWVYYYDSGLYKQRDIKKSEFKYSPSKDGIKTFSPSDSFEKNHPIIGYGRSASNSVTSIGKNIVMNLLKELKLYHKKANVEKEISNKIEENFK